MVLEDNVVEDKTLDSVDETMYDSELLGRRLVDEAEVLDAVCVDTISELDSLAG